MKLLIPEKIKSGINDIETVWLEFNNKTTPSLTCQQVIHKIHIEKMDFVITSSEQWDNSTFFQYRVLYKNKTSEIIKYPTKQSAIFRTTNTKDAAICMRHKVSLMFEDTTEGRNKCLSIIDDKIAAAYQISDKTVGDKNLIYYAVYFDKGYTDLLNLSVVSILKHSKINFDLLIITDEPTKLLIEKLPFYQKIKPEFLITSTPIDGVEASQNKVKIYKYDNLNKYNKVLFLDCDIVCIKDINFIFNKQIDTNTIYGARPLTLDYGAHSSVWHGFPFLGQSIVDEMRAAKQLPFNAGQFLFRNSERMQEHFKNIDWFMENWTGEYFFEQAFMCYYFGKAYAIGGNDLDDNVTLINTTNDMKFVLDDKTHLIHFIAPPLQANKKIEFIKKYLKENFTFFSLLKRKFKKSFIYAIFKKIQSLFYTHPKDSRNNY